MPGWYVVNKTALGLCATYGDFVSGRKHSWFSGNGNQNLTPEEAEDRRRRMAAEAAKIEASQERRHQRGAWSADFNWGFGKPAKSHRYLDGKQVKSHGLRILDLPESNHHGRLMVPAYSSEGELQTLQYIDGQGAKLFEKDGKKVGAYFPIKGDRTAVVCEGYATGASIHEATGHSVAVAFDAGNLKPVAEVIREKSPQAEIIIAADNDAFKPEAGNTGIAKAEAAAVAVSARVAIPQFEDTSTKPTDFNDLSNLEGPDAVRAQIGAAAPVDKVRALRIELADLVKLDLLEQEVERERLSKSYGVRKSIVDKYLDSEDPRSETGGGIVEDVEPWAQPVDGAQLLDGILADIQKRIILPVGAAEAVTLWALLTYTHQAFGVLPILGITSPVKRCGKTKLLETLSAYTYRALSASNMTAAAVYRTIEKYKPTLLIDEGDTFLRDNDELRGVINSGHTRASAFVVRIEGDSLEPIRFSTWGMKAISMIGRLPDTVEDRSVAIHLARKAPGETVLKTGLDFAEQCKPVRAMCRRWADDNMERLKTVTVTVPPSGNDRADDNWHPLFTIAETIGGDWPERARNSMEKLCEKSDDSVGAQLLADIKGVFEAQGVDRIFSRDLVEALKNLTEAPWNDWNRGKGLTTNALSRLLKPFSIISRTVRVDVETAKGYRLDLFRDAFSRYLPCDTNVTTSQDNKFGGLAGNQNVTRESGVTFGNGAKLLKTKDCYVVTDENTPGEGGEEVVEEVF